MYAGIDYSITSPAATMIDEETLTVRSLCFTPNKKTPFESVVIKGLKETDYTFILHCESTFDWKNNGDVRRYYSLAKKITNFLQPVKYTIALEGYSYGSDNLAHRIGENTGILKLHLFRAGFEDVIIVPPSTLKKYIVKGNATKEQIHDLFVSETGYDLQKHGLKRGKSPCSDIIDSFYLAKYAQTNFNLKQP